MIRQTCSPRKTAGRHLPGRTRTVVSQGPGSRKRNSSGIRTGGKKTTIQSYNKRRAAVEQLAAAYERNRSRREEPQSSYSNDDGGFDTGHFGDCEFMEVSEDSSDSSSQSESDNEAYNDDSLETTRADAYQKVGLGRTERKQSQHVHDAVAQDANWKLFIELNTGREALQRVVTSIYRCNCQQTRLKLNVLRLNCIFQQNGCTDASLQ